MAMQAFLKIAGIKGECKNPDYADYIDIKNFTWDISQKHSVSTGGGMGGGGRPEIGAFHFEKDCDKSSTDLFKNCLSGKHFTDAHVVFLKAAGDYSKAGLPFLSLDFEKVFITKFNISGSSDYDTPGESVEFVSEKFESAYQEQDESGGAKGDPARAGWDVKANRPTTTK